ncbi:MAG: 50S ribosomal protein L17 [Deltaproteobacteria bacterium]|jgi:large subunit ribosomal protein L17|nr:50S ribosomal protein L17 [Deltaproteobacteria bacterium]
MRHRNSGRKLGRTAPHRKALFKNMATALLTYGRITTTEAKAKEIRGVVEPLITLAQCDDLHSRRQAYRALGNHKLVKRLFDEVAPAFKGIPGGYTRVVKLAMPRKGDCAPMAIIELIRGQHLEAANAKAEDVKAEAPVADAATVENAESAKPKAVKAKEAKPKAAKASTKGSQSSTVKPKSAPRKMGG